MIPSRLFIIIVFTSLFSACMKTVVIDPVNDDSPVGTVWKLNKNVEGLKKMAIACMEADSVAFFDFKHNDDGSILYWLYLKGAGEITLFNEIISNGIRVPDLSMEKVDEVFYWTVNGVFLTDSEGDRFAVTDVTRPVTFYYNDELICCKVKESIVAEYPMTDAQFREKDVTLDFDIERMAFNLELSSGFTASLPALSNYWLLLEPVQNQVYYKDIFLDAGISLDSMKSLSAAKLLNLSLEGIALPYSNYTAEHRAIQMAIISGDSIDSNGRLLYPDGQPRYKLLYVIGGDSIAHGTSLGADGREIMRAFVENGGSYVGSCAGAFLASNGYDGHENYEKYLSLWPGMMRHSGIKDAYTGMFIEEDSPLLQYFDFGLDHYVDSVRHNYGGYAESIPDGTEVLARYDTPNRRSVHQTPCIWAYKLSHQSGRVVLTGSHPEIVSTGERRDLTAAMLQYALDGRGTTALKGFLRNGVKREMCKTTEDNDPSFTRIGDLQVHHFVTFIPSDAKNIQVELTSPSKCDFALRMSQESYAFPDIAEYESSEPGPNQRLFFSSISEGYWFISVQCLSTVTINATNYGQEYSGNTGVLNGVPYTISISWE